MSVIQDSEYILYKAVAKLIEKNLAKPLKNLSIKCLNDFIKYEKQKNLFMGCESYEDLGDNSNKLKTSESTLIVSMAVQDRLEKILKRNEERIAFISEKLSAMGIYNEVVDKKTLAQTLAGESKNVSEGSLNLNPRENNGVTLKFFNGEILAFKEDNLDFSLPENRNLLISCSQELLHEIIFTFPYSVATIPDDLFVLANVKNKILKECVLFAAANYKTQSIAQSNKQLGGLLFKCDDITLISNFANELRNYFNVVAKQYLRNNNKNEEISKDIEMQLRCDEKSRYLPRSRVFESAEIFEDDEKADNNMSTDELLGLLLDDADILAEIENEAEEEESSETPESTNKDLDDMLKELEDLFEDNDDKKDDAVE